MTIGGPCFDGLTYFFKISIIIWEMKNMVNNKKNTLFDWATKELSQDAVVAWLLNSENGTALLKDMCPNLEDGYKIKNIEIQKQGIDILVEVENKEDKQAIIIEDKTDTYLHDCQMLKYIAKISKTNKYSKIFFVLFKTGYVYEWEHKDYVRWQNELNETKGKNIAVKELNDSFNGLIISGGYQDKDIVFNDNTKIYIEEIYDLYDFYNFIEGIENKEPVLEEYFEFCKHLKEELKSREEDNKQEDKYYKVVIDTIEGTEVELRMIRPSGAGKRNYDYCFYSKNFFKFSPDNPLEIEKISDNYFILPYIKKEVKDNEISYKYIINYNLIGNIKKQNGYVPYNQLNLDKDKFGKFKECLRSQIEKNFKNDKEIQINNSKKENRLQILSFTRKEITKEDIGNLLKYAKDIADIIKNQK